MDQPIPSIWRTYWRIPVVGLMAGLIAYGGSFILGADYESTSQILLRGRDTTFLTGTGEALRDQSVINDTALATALAATQGALVSSRNIARTVVDQLGLDQPDPTPRSPFAIAKDAMRRAVNRVVAYVRYGFYTEPDPYEAAVEEVYAGLSARQVEDSYVIELTATGPDPATATAIADAAADALVTESSQRFRADATAYRDFLKAQLDRASAEEVAASQSVRAFKEQNDVGDVLLEIELSTRSSEDLRTELTQTEVDLEATRAELDAIESSLKQIASTDSSVSQIQTGRSTTEIRSTAASNAYQQLVLQRETLEADLASLEARRIGIERVLGSKRDAEFSDLEAQLRQLELQREVAAQAVAKLSDGYQQAVLTAASDVVEITRLEPASQPLYPVSPKRYLFLLLGALAGAAGGLILSTGRRPSVDGPLVVDLRDESGRPTGDEPIRYRIEGFEVFRGRGLVVSGDGRRSRPLGDVKGSERNESSGDRGRWNAGERGSARFRESRSRGGRHRH